MKRTFSLVRYESSDDEPEQCRETAPKRKLPRISPALTVTVPNSDPRQHQGRIRSFPHVEGQFAAFVYIPLILSTNRKLFDLLRKTVEKANEIVPELMCDWSENEVCELHISLTRPIYIRHHQREELKRAVRSIARSNHPFTASFSTFSSFTNDENTRTFLGIDIGAGHKEMEVLSNSIHPTLQLLRQKEFHKEPRFHISIAWALLESAPISSTESSLFEPSVNSPGAKENDKRRKKMARAIHSFPSNLVPALNTLFVKELSSGVVGTFDVDRLCVRIGKEVSNWNLTGT